MPVSARATATGRRATEHGFDALLYRTHELVGAVIATGMGFILRRPALQTDAPEEAEDGVGVPPGAVMNA